LITGGERKAAALLGLALQGLGIPADSFTGAQAGIVTDGAHTQATIVAVHPDRIRAALDAGRVPVVGGAQGISTNGDITFIGRGGTDTTAVALACALGADACEIYSDVPGVFTANPGLVPDARLLDQLSFEEMIAMCHAGCPKPATSAAELAYEHGVRLRVCSALEGGGGTWIDGRPYADRGPVTAVVADPNGAGESDDTEDAGRVSIVGPGVTTDPDPSSG
jgi:aspartate kinase